MTLKIKDFFRFLFSKYQDLVVPACETALMALIISNLFFITQASTYFDIAKYVLSTLLALVVAILLNQSKSR